eukprot:768565-Hanusia_phi.AAC.3
MGGAGPTAAQRQQGGDDRLDNGGSGADEHRQLAAWLHLQGEGLDEEQGGEGVQAGAGGGRGDKDHEDQVPVADWADAVE